MIDATNKPYLVQHFLENSAGRLPDKIALICGNERWTYRQIDAAAEQLAAGLVKLGIRHQDRVVIFLENTVETVVSLFGILKAGGIFVILNPGMKTRRLKYILNNTGARTLITHPNRSPIIKGVIQNVNDLEDIIWCSDTVPHLFSKNTKHVLKNLNHYVWKQLLSDASDLSSALCPLSSGVSDLATIIYTSGSTGSPQGVMSAHSNVIAAASSIVEYLENVEDDVILNAFPMAFDYGLYQVLMAFLFGGTVVLEKSFAYPYKIIEILVQERITGFPIVPTIAALLLQMKDVGKFDFSCLRYLTNTADRLPVDTIRRLQAILPQVSIYSMYGLTECKRVSYLPPDELQNRPKSVGKPMPGVEAFIVNEFGQEVGPDEVGELVVKGLNVMQGYWNDPEATSRKFRPGCSSGDTLLFTGDLFKKDREGYLYFISRKDDLIKTKSQRVSPKEIENALCDFDGVLEAAVIGIPDDIIGHSIKAIVIPANGTSLSENLILEHCRQELDAHMVPGVIEFRNYLPKLYNGKIDRKRLVTESC